MRMHRGAVIPHVDERYLDNMYKVRGALQVMLAREVATRATPLQCEELQRLREAHEEAVAANDVLGCVKAKRALHHAIDSLADNPPAIEVLAARSCRVDARRSALGYGPGRLDTVIAQHRRLVRAIAQGDADKAALVTFEHTESSRLDLLAAINRRGLEATRHGRP